jgi:hypothetical protein
MQPQKYIPVFFLILLVSLTPSGARAESFAEVPEKLQAALFIKILTMSKEMNNGKELRIHVVNAPDVAAELRKAVGLKIGKSTLTEVNEGPDIPSDAPDALYIGNGADLDRMIQYTREKGILSMTGNPELVEKGVTLGVGVSENKPKILLNAAASQAENITWNPALFKISKIYK